MPIAFEDHECGELCSLTEWRIVDADLFVTALAWLYLRKPRHASRVLEALLPGGAHFPGNEFDAAIELLDYKVADLADDLASEDDDVRDKAEGTLRKRIEQRDGLLFQHISWISAYLRHPGAYLSPPHVRKADKGFDGVLLKLKEEQGGVSCVILCEDKATTNPRPLVTQSIWPEIEGIVAGRRDLEILDYVTAILDRVDGVDAEEALKDVTWDKVRRFRVAVTCPDDQARDGSYAHLFEGFDDVAPQNLEARMGEVMSLGDVRAFLDEIARATRDVIQALKDEADV
jgi:hypothetical protein